jgi:hypothetical protein
MNFKYDILFSVNFRHSYFKGEKFNGLTAVPSGETTVLMRRHGLIFKSFADHFTLMYDAEFAGSPRSREEVLQDDIMLSFRLNLNDLALYNYTGGLPTAINNSFFYFSNASADGSFKTINLHEDPFANTKDFIELSATDEQYFSKPFGHLDIVFHPGLEKNMEVRFAAKAVHWQYILVSEHMKELNAPAVFNKSTKQIFTGPETIQLPDDRTGIAFISEEPILLNSEPNRLFQLVENYESGSDKYKIIMDVLPNPDINIISQNFSTQNTNGEKSLITIIL